jgi:hypothetical protein
MNVATLDDRSVQVNILNLSYDRVFFYFKRKHKTLPVGHCKHIVHSSPSSSKETIADWHKKWLGPDDKTLYFTHTGYHRRQCCIHKVSRLTVTNCGKRTYICPGHHIKQITWSNKVYVTFNNDSTHFTSDHSCSYKYIKFPFTTPRKEHTAEDTQLTTQTRDIKNDKLWKLSAQIQH